MSLAKGLLAELDQECAMTRKVLDRLPDGKFDWKPHPRSMSLGELGSHLAEVLFWIRAALEHGSFDIWPVGGQPYRPETLATRDAVLRSFDQNLSDGQPFLERATDAALLEPWSLQKKGAKIFEQQRTEVIRSMILNHMVHHRGQLTVYLRMNEVPLPALYGPSADEEA